MRQTAREDENPTYSVQDMLYVMKLAPHKFDPPMSIFQQM